MIWLVVLAYVMAGVATALDVVSSTEGGADPVLFAVCVVFWPALWMWVVIRRATR